LWFWSENNELKFSDFTLFFTILNDQRWIILHDK
jgi:hypothetical protein